jgi:hypothetical protein
MSMYVKSIIAWATALLMSGVAISDDFTIAKAEREPILDKKYRNIKPPLTDARGRSRTLPSVFETVYRKQTPVQSQGSRGTCSIFSAIGLLESMMVIKHGEDARKLNLSEEFLEYLAVRTSTSDGSSSTANFGYLRDYGTPLESTWNYVGQTWEELGDGDSREFCGHIPTGESKRLRGCLLAHRDPKLLNAKDADLLSRDNTPGDLYDPKFVEARNEAAKIRDTKIRSAITGSFWVGRESEVKALLSRGVPVTLDIDFYYGAWNHSKAASYGIGRDMDQWAKGIVNYPERGSMDRQESVKHGAGHSVVIMGFDNIREVITKVKMTDGSVKEFKRKGVYYFKNSWGTGSFGTQFEAAGIRAPGYGMITQDYAHEFGAFYKL